MTSLFHYTDAAGLKGILERQELWCTDIQYLNDSSEFIAGANLFVSMVRYNYRKKHFPGRAMDYDFESLRKYIIESFGCSTGIASFCGDDDLLSQWRGYCPKEGGYCIEFEKEKLPKKCTLPNENWELEECVYDETLLEMPLTNIGEKITAMSGSFYPDQFSAQYELLLREAFHLIAKKKALGFKEENETRLVGVSDQKNFQFRTNRQHLLPYLKFKFDYDAVKSIVVGPMASDHQAIAKKAVNRFLKYLIDHDEGNCRHGHIPKVRTSNITLRI